MNIPVEKAEESVKTPPSSWFQPNLKWICGYLVVIICVQFLIVFRLKNEVDLYHQHRSAEREEAAAEGKIFGGEVDCEEFQIEKCCQDKPKAHSIWKRQADGNGTCPPGCIPRRRRKPAYSGTTSSSTPGYTTSTYYPYGDYSGSNNYGNQGGYSSWYSYGYPSYTGYSDYSGYPASNGYGYGWSSGGYPGAVGSPGYPGETGWPGATGWSGSPGWPGEAGMPGEPGMPGEAGMPGDPGWPGGVGMAGNPGRPGARGPAGQAGLPGMPGNAGMPGLPGGRGQPGSAGAPGISGGRGRPGGAGLPGRPGSPGSAGGRGVQGPSGGRGQPGPRPQNGYQGQSTNGLHQNYQYTGRGDQGMPTEDHLKHPMPETQVNEVLREFALYDHPKCKTTVDHRALMNDLTRVGKVSFMILVDLEDSVYCIVHA